MRIKADGTIEGLAVGGLPNASVLPADMAPSYFTAALGADVALNNSALYFDGPSVAQGSAGIWLVIAQVCVRDNVGASSFAVKLTDGVTTIGSAYATTASNGFLLEVTVAGVIANPVGNLRVSVRDNGSSNGTLAFNASGNSKDCTITAVRIG